MMKNFVYTGLLMLLLFSCESKGSKIIEKPTAPAASNGGTTIFFPDAETALFFKTEKVTGSLIEAELNAPGVVSATVLPSGSGAAQNLVLFENSDLSSNYTMLIQHQINIAQKGAIIAQKENIIAQKEAIIRQKQIELERFKDLAANGVGTGKDVADAQTELLIAQTEKTAAQTELQIAQTELSNEKAAIIEHETKLKSAGFDPEVLRSAAAGTAFITCDIPENQIAKIKEGQSCTITFNAFTNEKLTGKIDAVADMLDNSTRMVKVRISVQNPSIRLKSGMFANVSLGMSEGNFINISKNSLITVQGKNYVFVKPAPNTFQRKEVQIGAQIGDRIVVFGGLSDGEEIAVEGVMQLKGLSFGY
jgi:multidrug efflux pump subunit AcrA (membrane-fusion protein)